MKIFIALILLLFFKTNVYGQGPPITVETPVMLGLEGNGIRTFGKFISKENVNVYVQSIAFPYNLTTKFQVGVIFPFKFITSKNSNTIGGFADMTVFAKYQLYKKDGKAKTFRILGFVKQTFSTGKTSSTPPIGSGISQTYVGIVMGKLSIKKGLYANFGYNITNNNSSDNFLYNFSAGAPLLSHKYPQRQLNTYLEFNGNYEFDSKVHSVFISPGLQFIPGSRILFETSFQIPIVQNNITTNKTNYMVSLGTRFLLN